MPSIKDLKKRIGTVKNTQQTTRAMKMVSAAKLRRAQDAILNHRPYAKKIEKLILDLGRTMAIPEGQFPLLASESESKADRKLLLVLVTSDRGLCGGFNSNAIKKCQKWMNANQAKYASIEMAYVGRKGYEFFRGKRSDGGRFLNEISGKVAFVHARKLADYLIGRFLGGEVDEIKIVYNEFKNAVSQEVIVEPFLPYELKVNSGSSANEMEAHDFIAKPSQIEVMKQLLDKNFAVQSFRILLESQASEHGARMSAMENATKNAGEMIRKLALQYNKQRQAGITKELLEIISGSESQKA